MAGNRPTNAELIEAVVEFLNVHIRPELKAPDLKFKLRIAMNVLGIVERECLRHPVLEAAEQKVLQALLQSDETDVGELNRVLCEQIRRGDLDARHDELVQVLTQTTMGKLSIDNPRYSTYLDLEQE